MLIFPLYHQIPKSAQHKDKPTKISNETELLNPSLSHHMPGTNPLTINLTAQKLYLKMRRKE